MRKQVHQDDDQVKQEESVEENIVEGNEQALKLEEANNKYLRALADYQNLERQTSTWKEEFAKYAGLGLIRKILEVLDDLEKAQEHLKDEGLALVVAKLRKILFDEGLEEEEVLGKEYDPGVAEAVGTQPGESDNIIVQVVQKGYRLKEKVIRPAKVIVSVKS